MIGLTMLYNFELNIRDAKNRCKEDLNDQMFEELFG